MAVNKTTNINSRRKKAASNPASSDLSDVHTDEGHSMSSENTIQAENSEVPKEEKMSADSSESAVKLAALPVQAEPQQASEIQLHQPVSLVWNRPVMPSDIEVADTMTVAGVRPIAASHLQLFGSFLNGRPIESSAIRVQTMLPGGRPVFADTFKLVDGSIIGGSPIMASDPKLMEASLLLGNRPIAANDVDDPETLMGFLD